MGPLKRGDLVTAVLPRSLGKPRPALIIQADAFSPLPTITLLPLTSDLREAPFIRIAVEPESGNGLDVLSQVQIDKLTTVPRAKVGRRIGSLDDTTLGAIDDALSRFLVLS